MHWQAPEMFSLELKRLLVMRLQVKPNPLARPHSVTSMQDCPHNEVDCLNPYEFIRKYRCKTCDAVMMCKCDEHRGQRFLPHQLREGTELASRRRVMVTRGFVANLCRECRGLKPLAEPVAAIHGRTTKLRRYYWREIFFREKELLADGIASDPDEAERIALTEIKTRHESDPKYDMSEESESDFLTRTGTEIVSVSANVLKGGRVERPSGGTASPEAFAAEYFRGLGFDSMPCESTPFHALFAVLLWTVVQDYGDPLVSEVQFGERSSFERDRMSDRMIMTALPEDFGCKEYAARRNVAVERMFSRYLSGDRRDLQFAFKFGVDGSFGLRQYLWAHRDEDLERAQRLLAVLPPDAVRRCLRYLVDDYWGNYLGWPDLLMWKGHEYLFVEVKLSRDKLSDEQRSWIEANIKTLQIPFQILKIHRSHGAG